MITAIILTKNESKNIESCMDSLSWCDEIIVIDDESEDNTVSLAKKKGASVYTRALGNDFATQRNFGLQKAKEDWVLFIDADERVPLPLSYEIQSLLSHSSSVIGYTLLRKDTVFGKKLSYGETGTTKLLRLGKKHGGEWKGKVHERWEIKGRVESCKNVLEHYPHPTVKEFLTEIQYYTTLRAQELYEKKTKVYWWHIILYPKAKFFMNYILKRGFMDGTEGMIHAIVMSFHSFLVRSKLWMLYRQDEK